MLTEGPGLFVEISKREQIRTNWVTRLEDREQKRTEEKNGPQGCASQTVFI